MRMDCEDGEEDGERMEGERRGWSEAARRMQRVDAEDASKAHREERRETRSRGVHVQCLGERVGGEGGRGRARLLDGRACHYLTLCAQSGRHAQTSGAAGREHTIV